MMKMMEGVTMMKTNRWLRVLLLLLTSCVAAASFAAARENEPANLTGKWQLSWEARLGTESGTMQLEQVDSTLTGSYHGHLDAPRITGTVEAKNITLKLQFQRAHPFTIVFTGTIDGDKMAGKFEIQEVPDGYDWHGENARPSNYSWTAVRQADPAPAEASAAKPSKSEEKLQQ
jgi:hypothetical protein